jgi:hypothetical protein
MKEPARPNYRHGFITVVILAAIVFVAVLAWTL